MLKRDFPCNLLLLAALAAAALLLASRSWDPAAANNGYPVFPSDAHIGHYKDGDVRKGVVYIPGTTTPLHTLFETDNRVKEMIGVPGQGLIAWQERPMGGPADVFLVNLDQQENWPPTSLRDLHSGMVEDIGSVTGCGNYLFYTGLVNTQWRLYQFYATNFSGPGSFQYDDISAGVVNSFYDVNCLDGILTFAIEGTHPGNGTIVRAIYAADSQKVDQYADTLTDYCTNPVVLGPNIGGGLVEDYQVGAFCQPAPLPQDVGNPAQTFLKLWDFDTGDPAGIIPLGVHDPRDIRDLNGWPEHGIYTFTAPSCTGQTPIPDGRDLCVYDITDPTNPVPLNLPNTNVSWYYINGEKITFRNQNETDWYRATIGGVMPIDNLIDTREAIPGGTAGSGTSWSTYWYNGHIYESSMAGLAKQ